ncbi:hypothetical protein PR048_006498 [Dryococelus australis]|uniref:Protein charybde n=1 Tax=Dryococelus australis TaxID=614101 RepID=A0ABQ9IB57_9NEOP|nr:hypothetical protein PR048_006498 [Dryococelus australis]
MNVLCDRLQDSLQAGVDPEGGKAMAEWPPPPTYIPDQLIPVARRSYWRNVLQQLCSLVMCAANRMLLFNLNQLAEEAMPKTLYSQTVSRREIFVPWSRGFCWYRTRTGGQIEHFLEDTPHHDSRLHGVFNKISDILQHQNSPTKQKMSSEVIESIQPERFNVPINELGWCGADDAEDGAATRALARRLEEELRAAKSAQLACGEVLLPADLLPRVARDVLRMAENEPCGLRGCTLFVNFETEQMCRRIGTIKCDPNTVSTFELFLTLKQDSTSWHSLLPQFLNYKIMKKTNKELDEGWHNCDQPGLHPGEEKVVPLLFGVELPGDWSLPPSTHPLFISFHQRVKTEKCPILQLVKIVQLFRPVEPNKFNCRGFYNIGSRLGTKQLILARAVEMKDRGLKRRRKSCRDVTSRTSRCKLPPRSY